jgi:hypothetical protein
MSDSELLDLQAENLALEAELIHLRRMLGRDGQTYTGGWQQLRVETVADIHRLMNPEGSA